MPASLGNNPLDHEIEPPDFRSNSPAPVTKNPGTITYPSTCGHGVESVPGIALRRIEDSCPLLAAAFETTRAGPRLHLETLNSMTARPFVRFLQSGSYSMTEDGDIYAVVPSSILLHLQLYHLAIIYELPPLKDQANVNVIRQCEFGCSSPDRPIDLIEGIRYAYKHLHGETGLLNTIISYCVSHLSMLESTADFRQLASDLRPFSQDLCKENMRRGFEDESHRNALEQCEERMAFSNRTPEEVKQMFNFHPSEEVDLPSSLKKRKRLEILRERAQSVRFDPAVHTIQDDYDERKVLRVMNWSSKDEVHAESDNLEDVLRKIRDRHNGVSRDGSQGTRNTFIQDLRRDTMPEPTTSDVEEEMDYADDGLADWVAETYAARVPEVKAAESYSNASSGPLFHFDDMDGSHQAAYEKLTKLEIKFNFEERHDRSDRLAVRATSGLDVDAELSPSKPAQEVGHFSKGDSIPVLDCARADQLWKGMLDNLAAQKSVDHSDDEDFLLMRPTERAVKTMEGSSRISLHDPANESTAVRGHSDVVEETIVRDDVGSDSGSDSFEHVEHPNRSTLPLRQRVPRLIQTGRWCELLEVGNFFGTARHRLSIAYVGVFCF
ncbi:unnamed protein product [Zymoseptoria tritici ST99CH_1E4]|uniref:BTB domain-containing protein n=1 Tax=Zymoseptoria tritici ST99CH_1E4 TaxID=1276532 RepID=A0A2H1G5H0_ZYMTR|nr:unnamed protein product [Zymoseptoria tritici ST99CH_1E4]